MRLGRVLIFAGLVGGLVGAPRSACGDEPWKRISDKDGIVLERREVPGNSFFEFRASARTKVSPDRIAQALWADRNGRYEARYRRKYEVLWERGDDRLFYEWLRTPIVSDRDYAVRMHRSPLTPTGTFHLDFHLDDRSGPPPPPNCVRAKSIRGSWDVSVTPDGSTLVVYTIHTDPGGSIPAFLATPTQSDTTREILEDVIEYASRHSVASR